MANYERGAQSDDVRVFDGGEDDEDVEGSRLPLLIVIALLVLAAFGAVVWLAYQRGVAQGHSEVPRVIAAEQGPAKVAPTSAGGTPTPYTGLKIYQQPAPSDEEAANDTATAAPSAPPKPAAATPAPPKPAPVATSIPTKPVAVASVPPAAKPAASPPPAVKPAITTAPASKPAVAPPAAHPAAVAAVTPPPVAHTPPATAPAAVPAPPPAAPAIAGGGLLQIGSYKSEAEANAAWTTYRAKHAGLLGGVSTDVRQVDLGAKGTWFRLRIVTASKADAATLCTKLKADGGDCIPAK